MAGIVAAAALAISSRAPSRAADTRLCARASSLPATVSASASRASTFARRFRLGTSTRRKSVPCVGRPAAARSGRLPCGDDAFELRERFNGKCKKASLDDCDVVCLIEIFMLPQSSDDDAILRCHADTGGCQEHPIADEIPDRRNRPQFGLDKPPIGDLRHYEAAEMSTFEKKLRSLLFSGRDSPVTSNAPTRRWSSELVPMNRSVWPGSTENPPFLFV